MAPTRWGICGTGFICNDFVSTLASLPESENKIVAVASRTKAKAESFAKRFGIPQALGSYEELAEMEGVDVVYVGTLTSAHAENSMLFINAGKNVLCETPMALSLEGCQRVLAAAKEKGVFFMEAIWTVFNPVYEAIRKSVNSGELGEIRHVQINFTVPMGAFDSSPRVYDFSLGAGIWAEIGCYQARVANMIFKSEPVSVQSDLFKTDKGIDTHGWACARYPNGGFAVFTVGDDTDRVENFCIIRGTKGDIKVPDVFWSPTSVIMANKEEIKVNMKPIPEGRHYVYPNGQNFEYEINAVRNALLNGKQECEHMTWADSEAAMKIEQEVYTQNNIKYIPNNKYNII